MWGEEALTRGSDADWSLIASEVVHYCTACVARVMPGGPVGRDADGRAFQVVRRTCTRRLVKCVVNLDGRLRRARRDRGCGRLTEAARPGLHFGDFGLNLGSHRRAASRAAYLGRNGTYPPVPWVGTDRESNDAIRYPFGRTALRRATPAHASGRGRGAAGRARATPGASPRARESRGPSRRAVGCRTGMRWSAG